jgi:hypothetical protein
MRVLKNSFDQYVYSMHENIRSSSFLLVTVKKLLQADRKGPGNLNLAMKHNISK